MEASGRLECCMGHLLYFKAGLDKLAHRRHQLMIRASVL